MKKKYGFIGTILSISVLLTLMILGPNAVAATPVDGGDLLSQVQSGSCTTVAVATGFSDHDERFYSNNVVVTTDWTIDNQCNGPAYHGFYLRVINLEAPPVIDEDGFWVGPTTGPTYETGQLEAEVPGSIGDRIEIYIYVNVTYGFSFAEDSDTWIITLTI